MGIVATLLALVGLLAALGHVGYLALMGNAARKKGASGAQIARDTKSRLPVAGGAAAVALLGLLITGADGFVPDLFGILLAAGGGVVGYRGLRQEQARYNTN